MLTSRTKLNLLLLIVVVLLILVLVYKPGKPGEQPRHLSTIDKQSINHIRLERINAATIEFARQQNEWVMLSPYVMPTTQINVESLLDLLDYDYRAAYPVDQVELKNYDLDHPRTAIIYNKQYRFEFGKTEPLEKLRYIKHDRQMYLTDDFFQHRILGAATSFIATNMIANGDQIEQIKLPDFSLTFNDGNWEISPADKSISNDRANQLVENWQRAHAIGVISYKEITSQGKVSIKLKNRPQALVFDIVVQDNDFYLARSDLKIMYKFAVQKRRNLLQLPPAINAGQLEQELENAAPANNATTKSN